MKTECESTELMDQTPASPWSTVNMLTATATGYLIAVLTAVLIWKNIPLVFLSFWMIAVGVAFGIGIIQAIMFQANKLSFFRKNSTIIIASTLFGFLWGAPGIVLTAGSQHINMMMYAFTIVLMLGWASIYFSTIRFQFLAFSIPFTAPIIVRLLYQGPETVMLAGVIFASLVILAICTSTAHHAVQNGINSFARSLQKLHNQLSLQHHEKQQAIAAVIESEQQMRELVDATFEGILVHDNGIIIDTNKTLADMIGIAREDAIGRNILEFVSEDSKEIVVKKLEEKSSDCFEVVALRTDGSTLPVEFRTTTYHFKNRPVRIVAIRDITDRKDAEKDIFRLSNVDALTGLPNRKQLKESLEHTISGAKSKNCMLALLIVDIDNFKLINETLGHEVGDELLQYVSLKISEAVRNQDVLTRWGDDEFAIILDSVENNEEIILITKRIQHVLSEFIVLNDQEIYASASIGCTTYPNDSHSSEGLISNAEAAVHRAKEKGHNNIEFYVAGFDRKTTERYELENSLRKAIENNEFELYYQPKIDLSSCEVIGVEALIRWRHPEKGLIQPGEFIPLAEQTGLIVPIGTWVLDEACRQVNAWKNIGLAPVPIAVNLSLRQLNYVNMLDLIMSTLARHAVAPEMLEIEITESSVAENYEQAVELMNGLNAAGISISIDDFGTGYSSLSYLKRFPVDYLKIDRSFIRYIPDDVDDTAIATTIIAMAENLGLKVIAEGVETQEQLNFLQEKGCYSVQGFLISEPLSEKNITEWLNNPPTRMIFKENEKRNAFH